MALDKHDRMAGMIQELSAKFIREEALSNPLITVTRVMVSPDYRKVMVLFTTIPEEKEGDAHIFLKRKGSEFRDYLKKHGKFKMIPHIDFEVDYGERHRQQIDTVVQRLEEDKGSSL